VLELDSARVSKTQADADYEVARSELQQRVADAERRIKTLAEQRDVLQQQLEKAAAETPGEGELTGCVPGGLVSIQPALGIEVDVLTHPATPPCQTDAFDPV
jgi:Tfp pilus assembly protein FimV